MNSTYFKEREEIEPVLKEREKLIWSILQKEAHFCALEALGLGVPSTGKRQKLAALAQLQLPRVLEAAGRQTEWNQWCSCVACARAGPSNPHCCSQTEVTTCAGLFTGHEL